MIFHANIDGVPDRVAVYLAAQVIDEPRVASCRHRRVGCVKVVRHRQGLEHPLRRPAVGGLKNPVNNRGPELELDRALKHVRVVSRLGQRNPHLRIPRVETGKIHPGRVRIPRIPVGRRIVHPHGGTGILKVLSRRIPRRVDKLHRVSHDLGRVL